MTGSRRSNGPLCGFTLIRARRVGTGPLLTLQRHWKGPLQGSTLPDLISLQRALRRRSEQRLAVSSLKA